MTDLYSEEIIGLTLYGEARGEPIDGIIAVANVIKNRMRGGKSAHDVCLAPSQFSCWNINDPNYSKLMTMSQQLKSNGLINDKYFDQCLYIANGIVNNHLLDNTNQSMNYMTKSLFYSPDRPSWALIPKGQLKIIGSHVFFSV